VSGSPILQDGKIIGAVTHVLISDPTAGYGIFIENMLLRRRIIITTSQWFLVTKICTSKSV